MTAATVAAPAPLARTTSPSVRTVALPLGIGGLLLAAGGQLHPHETKATVHDTLEHYLTSSVWDLSHLLSLAGILVAVVGLVLARRSQTFGPKVQAALSVAIWCWGLAAIELVPHVLARRDLDALRAEGSTPILDLHLLLAVFATPLFGLAAVALAIAVARSARTKPAWALAVLATIGGLAYAAAGPQIRFVGNVDLSVLFAGQAPIAI
ncbi:MAG TPA: hypothetical protein VFK43_12515, partial [Acidimicrobiales bacterium]|nr:hypothetical protein [Acidimicrobiales bacterium]